MASGGSKSLNIPDSPTTSSDTSSHWDMETQEDSTPKVPSLTLQGTVISTKLEKPERIAEDCLVKPINGQKEYDSHQVELTDQKDLETILQQLTDRIKLSISAKDPEEIVPLPIVSMENSAKKRHEQVMEQLVELSARQSQARTPVQCLRGEHGDNEVVNPGSCNSRSTASEKKMNLLHKGRHTENIPTVVLDLRVISSSPSLLNDRGEETAKKTPRRADMPQPVHTGKSALLRQLRNNKMRPCSTPPDPNAQQPVTSSLKPAKGIRSHQEQRLNCKEDVHSRRLQNIAERPEKDGSFKEGDAKEKSPKKSNDEPRKIQESHR
ncbi:hypothetical protein GDO78_017131 [Eleutherodactylus coqui]|uniref:Uncharacterized protein n=1 Tax=Eleutherodactylus coqui TaxID=57060 RepID=A0A8J6EJR2_ELECQ|nr:hypothetical protein GDO78_017131 [Eleutherodactylus coqui]